MPSRIIQLSPSITRMIKVNCCRGSSQIIWHVATLTIRMKIYSSIRRAILSCLTFTGSKAKSSWRWRKLNFQIIKVGQAFSVSQQSPSIINWRFFIQMTQNSQSISKEVFQLPTIQSMIYSAPLRDFWESCQWETESSSSMLSTSSLQMQRSMALRKMKKTWSPLITTLLSSTLTSSGLIFTTFTRASLQLSSLPTKLRQFLASCFLRNKRKRREN